jgi:YD repeat-containing protein
MRFLRSVVTLFVLTFVLLVAHAQQAYWTAYNPNYGDSVTATLDSDPNAEATVRANTMYWDYNLICTAWAYAFNDPNTGNISGPVYGRGTNSTRWTYPLKLTGCHDNYDVFRNAVYFTAGRTIVKWVCDAGYVAVGGGSGGCVLPSSPVAQVSTEPGVPPLKTTDSALDCGCHGSSPLDDGKRALLAGLGLVGDPINPSNGNVVAAEIDYAGVGANRLSFVRSYNSSSYAPTSGALGLTWRFSFEAAITPGSSYVILVRPDGRTITFSLSGSSYVAPAGYPTGTLTAVMNGSTRTGWRYTLENGDVETYTGNLLSSVAYKQGGGYTLTRQDGLNISSVTDGLGRTISLSYYPYATYSAYRLNRVTFPDATSVTYSYDGAGRLAAAAFSDGTSRQYQYLPATTADGHQNAFAGRLTAIVDEDGRVASSYEYDSQGRATRSTKAGGIDSVTLGYSGSGTTITDARGFSETHQFGSPTGYAQATGIVMTCPSGCPENGLAEQIEYDSYGNRLSVTDRSGALTCYSYIAARHLVTQAVEGLVSGTDSCSSALASPPSYAKTTTIQWSPSVALPTAITQPLLIQKFQLDSGGRISQLTEQPTNDSTGSSGLSAASAGSAFVTVYGWDAQGFLRALKSPRTDVASQSVFGRDGAENLSSITDPTGLVTTFSGYDANGRAGSIAEPTGLVTTLIYDGRRRTTQVNRGGAITTYSYSPAGLLLGSTLPSGVSLSMSYDAAGRLIRTSDSLGNSRALTLDLSGNVTQETVAGNGGALAFSRAMAFDQLSRLSVLTKAQ